MKLVIYHYHTRLLIGIVAISVDFIHRAVLTHLTNSHALRASLTFLIRATRRKLPLFFDCLKPDASRVVLLLGWGGLHFPLGRCWRVTLIVINQPSLHAGVAGL